MRIIPRKFLRHTFRYSHDLNYCMNRFWSLYNKIIRSFVFEWNPGYTNGLFAYGAREIPRELKIRIKWSSCFALFLMQKAVTQMQFYGITLQHNFIHCVHNNLAWLLAALSFIWWYMYHKSAWPVINKMQP